jgi:hypothetical protein
MNPVQLNNKKNEALIATGGVTGEWCLLRSGVFVLFLLRTQKEEKAGEAKKGNHGRYVTKGPGRRPPSSSLPSFQSFPRLASLFPIRSALSVQLTRKGTNIIPPPPRQISSLPHVAGPRRSGSHSICCSGSGGWAGGAVQLSRPPRSSVGRGFCSAPPPPTF